MAICKRNSELREVTNSHLMRDRPVMISSTMPSAKLHCTLGFHDRRSLRPQNRGLNGLVAQSDIQLWGPTGRHEDLSVLPSPDPARPAILRNNPHDRMSAFGGKADITRMQCNVRY